MAWTTACDEINTCKQVAVMNLRTKQVVVLAEAPEKADDAWWAAGYAFAQQHARLLNGLSPTAKPFKEFEDIEFPAWAQGLGFEDYSWHNDACARALLRMANGNQLCLWVDFDNPEEREGGPGTKYGLTVMDADDDQQLDEILNSDSAEEIEAAVRKAIGL